MIDTMTIDVIFDNDAGIKSQTLILESKYLTVFMCASSLLSAVTVYMFTMLHLQTPVPHAFFALLQLRFHPPKLAAIREFSGGTNTNF
jgi:hypothetical protein